MLIADIFKRIRFWRGADRIGPDMPLTYWMLFIPSQMKKLCKKKFASFGEGAEFRPGAYAIGCSKISIGKRVVIRQGCNLGADARPVGEGIVIEDDAMLGPGVHFYVHNHKFQDTSRPIIDQGYTDSRQITLKRGCWVGANSILLSGVTIGENAVVGAGSVVSKDVPDRTVVAGNPARVIKQL